MHVNLSYHVKEPAPLRWRASVEDGHDIVHEVYGATPVDAAMALAGALTGALEQAANEVADLAAIAETDGLK